jgi:hypothetical protein
MKKRSQLKMSKLVKKSKNNQAREVLQTPSKKGRGAVETKPKEYPRSYRLDSELKDVLENTLNRINELAPKKVSEARLVKALILLSKEMEAEKIIKALKEVW